MASVISDICTFSVFDPVSHNLLYSKYSFNFTLYSTSRSLDPTLTKPQIFKLFLLENNTTYDSPYTLTPGLEQFFNAITQDMIDYNNSNGNYHKNYMSFTNPSTYTSTQTYVNNQFDLVAYNDTKIRYIQDFTYTTNSDGLPFTKYNFDFDTYSNDFNVWGSKLFIFTDFVIRCIHVSNAIPGTFGYGLPDQYTKYFLVNSTLTSYLVSNGVTSNNLGVYKNPKNIDWNSYALSYPELNSTDPVVLKNHYYMYGQFELKSFSFLASASQLKNADLIINATATIYSKTGQLCSGFLYYNGDGKIYLVSCYHIIDDSSNKDILRASFGLSSKVSNVPSATTTAEFRIIGYDIMSDIIVGLFDTTLPYNSINNIDLSPYQQVGLTSSYSVSKGDSVFYIGNIGSIGNNALVSGEVVNDNYYGTLDSPFTIGAPDSILISAESVVGVSGSPLWIGKPATSDGALTCVGMINSKLTTSSDTTSSFTLGIQGKMMTNIINNIIGNWFYFSTNPLYANNTILLSYLLKLSSQKSWLGTTCWYYSTSTISKFPILGTLPYTGGLIIENFILGFNMIEKKYITDVSKLGEFSTIKLNTPLLNSNIYNRFIKSSRTPIVIKSITYFNALTSEFNKFFIGRYGNQTSFGSFTYGLLPVLSSPLTIPDADTYLFKTFSVYPTIEIEYFYYNGANWVLETETIGGTSAAFYSTYTDPIDNKFYQNNFILPYILYPYVTPYETGDLLEFPLGGVLGQTNTAGGFIPSCNPPPQPVGPIQKTPICPIQKSFFSK
jgi:hypothetical protein